MPMSEMNCKIVQNLLLGSSGWFCRPSAVCMREANILRTIQSYKKLSF